MDIFRFTVYTAPRPKKRPKVYRWSTVNPSEEDEALLAELIRELGNCPEEPYAGQIRVQFKFYKNPPKSTPKWKEEYMDAGFIRPNKSPDLDNYMKLAIDALNGILWEDDRYIVEMHAAKYYTTGKEKIEIIMEHSQPPQYMKDAEEIIQDYRDSPGLDEFFTYGDTKDDKLDQQD